MDGRRIRLERQAADGAVEFGVVEASGRDVSVTRGRGDEPGVCTTRQAISDQWVGEMFDKAVQRLRGEGFAEPRASQPVDAVAAFPDSDTLPEIASGVDTNSGLLFAAGQAVHIRGWTCVEVISTAEIATRTPVGDPLIVVASGADVSVDHARALAALHGAGRPVLLVTDTALSESVAAWIAPDSVVVATTNFATFEYHPTPADRVVVSNKEPGTPLPPTTDRRAELQRTLLTRLAADPDEGVAENPNTPPEVLAHLAGDKDSDVVDAVARNPRTPPEVLARLANEPDEYGLPHYELLRNPSTPPQILEGFATLLDEDAPRTVVGWARTQSEVLAQLATDTDSNVREGVASNPHTPPETLTRLANDQGSPVRWSVADNPDTPPETLTRLANDPFYIVRLNVADNPHTPPETLTRLANDPEDSVRRNVASNPHTPPETLTHLANDPEDLVRGHVAGNPHTPPETLTHLAAGPDWGSRSGVAGNPRTPPEVLERLARDPGNLLRAGVASNPAVPLTVLEAMVFAAESEEPQQ